jgi:aminotransferase
VLSESDLRALAETAMEHGLLIVADEAYEKFRYDGSKHFSLGSLPGASNNTISIFSFSKTYGMTGWRVGYAVAERPIIEQMTKLQEHVSAHPSSISQRAALAAYRGPQDHVAKLVADYTARRNRIVNGLNRIEGISCVQPGGAFYAFANFQSFGKPSIQIATDLIRKARVATVPGTAFGDYGEGYLRFTYASSMKDIETGLNRIEAVSKSL